MAQVETNQADKPNAEELPAVPTTGEFMEALPDVDKREMIIKSLEKEFRKGVSEIMSAQAQSVL